LEIIMTITIKTHLNNGIYKSSGGGEIRTHYEFTTGPRNLLKAIEQLSEHRSDMAHSYGNIGCGRSWLEIDGQAIDQNCGAQAPCFSSEVSAVL